MKKTLILILILSFSYLSMFSQDESEKGKWKSGGMMSLNASQVSFTNWSAGGQNSVAANSFVNLFANFKKNRMTWDNTLDLGYGKLFQGIGENQLIYKTDDKIDFSSKYGQFAFEHWYYAALIGFKTQFDHGFKEPTDANKISDFFAPAYLNVSLGMDYKPSDNFSLFISPLTGKMTFVTDEYLSNLGAFGVDPGKMFRPEFGGYLKAQYKVDFLKNMTYSTKLDLFSNYLEKAKNVDVNWENLLMLKINNWFSASIHYTMIYDDDININWVDADGIDHFIPKLQIKQMIGLGLTYKF
ncbi:MAG: DUF3078 domain-containing protein [Bacteroidales bacterium]|nr:DUF3078 domain-containing protein [Bacteroidales bacterium]